MPSTVPYSLVLVGLVLACSLAVLGQGETTTTAKPLDDPCFLIRDCPTCVQTKTNTTVSEATGNGTCVWELTRNGPQCAKAFLPSEGIIWRTFSVEGCKDQPSNTTTTTTPPSTTKPTSPPTPPPSTTTPPATPTTAPPTNTTTTTTTPSTNTTTTGAPTPPSNGTTPEPPTPKPTPAPAKGGFWAPFIGGIVFAVAVASLAYLIWRFYKVRLDRNYHTFSNPTF